MAGVQGIEPVDGSHSFFPTNKFFKETSKMSINNAKLNLFYDIRLLTKVSISIMTSSFRIPAPKSI